MQLMVTHVHDMNSGRCNHELKGMLASPPTGGMLSCHFLAIESIKKVFFTEFEMQYQNDDKAREGLGAHVVHIQQLTDRGCTGMSWVV